MPVIKYHGGPMDGKKATILKPLERARYEGRTDNKRWAAEYELVVTVKPTKTGKDRKTMAYQYIEPAGEAFARLSHREQAVLFSGALHDPSILWDRSAAGVDSL